jgi:cbb3-type cytochrome oxidase subunit 3
MRLGRSVLENIAGMEIFAIIGILIFFSFFIGLLIWVIRLKANKVDEFSRMPLEQDDEESEPELLNNENNEKS